MKTNLKICGLALAGGLFIGLSALADGIMFVARPGPSKIIPPVPVPVSLPVKYQSVQIAIDNQIATTSIDQLFKNDYDEDLEGTYLFPLPEDATITDFSMYADGKKVKGEIVGREKAQKVYEEIVRRMGDPGLLEYSGRNMFRARVYPVPKHGEKRIEFVYRQILSGDAGIYKYVYPLDRERFSPKPLEEVTISALINSPVPIKSLYSPSHEVKTTVAKFQAGCSYEAKVVKPDRDFVLYYTVSEKDVGLNLLCYRKPSEAGYFMMLLSPGEVASQAVSKDIVFVLDTSGSMKGDKIKQVKSAIRFWIRALNKQDRFNVIGFATDLTPYRDALVAAGDDNIKAALEFIDKFEARGGTNTNEALLAALKMFPDSNRPRLIVFLTNGESTIGETEMMEIVKNLSEANPRGVRIFAFGVGDDVDSLLLVKIARDHRGLVEYVAPGEDIKIKVASFYRKVSEPVLADINLNFGKIKVKEAYPVNLPDVFQGTQLVLLGRYEGEGATAVTVKGRVNGQEKKFVYEDRFPVESEENDFIPRIWATRKIGYLMSEIRLKGENRELIAEIVKLSKEFGIMTPYTSFLILEEEEDYRQWGIMPETLTEVKLGGKM